MRGFSNAPAKRKPAGPILPPAPPLDFARYAPSRPYEGDPKVIYAGHPKKLPERLYAVVASNKAPAPRASEDELAMLLNLAGKSFGQGFRCLWGIKRVLMTRARLRLAVAYHRMMQSHFVPWALAGGGWGMSMGLAVLVAVR